MNVKELRVGNYVHNNVESFALEAKDLIFLLSFDNEHYAEPIPITEEWLVKLGFDNSVDDEIPEGMEFLVYFKDNYSVEIFPDKLGLKNKYVFAIYENVVDVDGNFAMEGCYEKYIEYVHQLQNLYFDLSNEELGGKP